MAIYKYEAYMKCLSINACSFLCEVMHCKLEYTILID